MDQGAGVCGHLCFFGGLGLSPGVGVVMNCAFFRRVGRKGPRGSSSPVEDGGDSTMGGGGYCRACVNSLWVCWGPPSSLALSLGTLLSGKSESISMMFSVPVVLLVPLYRDLRGVFSGSFGLIEDFPRPC